MENSAQLGQESGAPPRSDRICMLRGWSGKVFQAQLGHRSPGLTPRKNGCACHEGCGVGFSTPQRGSAPNCPSWRSDASSPWMRRHTGGSWQDTHGTPVPSLLGRPWVVHDQNRYHKCHKHNVLFQLFFFLIIFAFFLFRLFSFLHFHFVYFFLRE